MRDVLWARALVVLARSNHRQPEAFLPTHTGWEPPIDVLETATGLLVVIALPGVRRADMDVVVAGGEVSIKGLRRWPELPRPSRVHRLELPHGHFERRLMLPAGSYRLIADEHTDGCLLLTLRRVD